VDGTWQLDLSSWIIQDGNYPDLRRGERVELAVEFGLAQPELVEPSVPSAELVQDSNYQVIGRVVFAAPEAWVIDCGILVFCDGAPPQGLAADDWVAGTAWLGVDPFFYFGELQRLPAMPALIYSWEIQRIRMQTAPFVEVAPRRMVRDPSRWGWTDIVRTDAWRDDDGTASYLLDCHLRDIPPKRSTRTAR
jgi:hypothetical protein